MSSESNPVSGTAWLSQSYDLARTTKSSSTPHHNSNRELTVSQDVYLEFNKYGQVASRSEVTGRVTGTKRGTLKETDVVFVPAGTLVVFYVKYDDAQAGSSVATFYLEKEQVTYRKAGNLRRVRV